MNVVNVANRVWRASEAENIDAAASMLDWQDAIINKPEHMYGF